MAVSPGQCYPADGAAMMQAGCRPTSMPRLGKRPEGAVLNKVSDKVADCYERANECRLKAEETLNEAFKREYLDMEDRWLLLARSYEFGDRLVDFTNETARQRQATGLRRRASVNAARYMSRMRQKNAARDSRTAWRRAKRQQGYLCLSMQFHI
jgi:hypothetical protein